ncbi:LysR family transcriptional regulator [uncultured Ferrovibrio sp.]|jgi:DNA-binding transcriptional LysR family regulator|uniref:LysR family transcriptional regulator n=1 Tax=uncultured Ferrovibrio sp. TaxID=1576913 RepID=UPI00261C3896|nr:LysR family transcriptional regulator [uncultured Ferrovibrio sp.]
MMYIHTMNLAAIDLNLLVALDALLTDAHVGRAAMRVGLSQPAMSHALRRLREMLDDPLLVRSGARMELTPRALALRTPLADALHQVCGLFVSEQFDPATSTRRFRLMTADHLLNLLIAPLSERFATLAPGVRLDVEAWRGPATMTPELARNIDLVVACTPEAFPAFHRQRLFADHDALAVRRGHPQTARLRRLDVFLKARHVAVVGRGQREDPIDTWLRETHRVERRIALTVPSYLQALHMASGSDLVAFVPRRLIEAQSRALSLIAVNPPLDPGLDEEFMFWPTRAQMDQGSIWLRQQVAAIGCSLDRARNGRSKEAA